ncbi:MAG: hypothetical protein CVU61_01825 [Deltaproteobacteria bacterium HGW-Deltaproteobacteria-19]|nr:MAG: hypothetical protein CVU61_01825 [Deltaproteobacteria bacterium HGW-Deltaproteobacteria-19]
MLSDRRRKMEKNGEALQSELREAFPSRGGGACLPPSGRQHEDAERVIKEHFVVLRTFREDTSVRNHITIISKLLNLS